jgi:hypothetical protein
MVYGLSRHRSRWNQPEQAMTHSERIGALVDVSKEPQEESM